MWRALTAGKVSSLVSWMSGWARTTVARNMATARDAWKRADVRRMAQFLPVIKDNAKASVLLCYARRRCPDSRWDEYLTATASPTLRWADTFAAGRGIGGGGEAPGAVRGGS